MNTSQGLKFLLVIFPALLQLRQEELAVADVGFVLLQALGELVYLFHAGELLHLLISLSLVSTRHLRVQVLCVHWLVVGPHYAADRLVGCFRSCPEGHTMGQCWPHSWKHSRCGSDCWSLGIGWLGCGEGTTAAESRVEWAVPVTSVSSFWHCS